MKKALPVLVVILLCAGGWYWWSSQHDSANTDATSGGAASATEVAVMTVQSQTINYKQELPGRVAPYRQSQVRPQVDGIVTVRLFEEGADVEKGQQLYQIDDARYKAALNSAIADLNSAKASVKSIQAREKRYKDLVKIDAVSAQEYDDVKAELDQANAAIAVAQAAVDVAEVNLGYTKVYAPISGRISRSFVTEGALVTANQAQQLAVITQLNPVYIDMQQSGTDAMYLRLRMADKGTVPVKLMADETTKTEYTLTGTLKFSEVTVDETTGAVALRALMPNPEGVLLPGLFVRATLDMGESEVLLVPQRATTRTAEGGLSVMVVDENNQAQAKEITVEQAFEDSWIISEGLQEGDVVIVVGYQKIAPGAQVSTVPWEKKSSAAPEITSGKE